MESKFEQNYVLRMTVSEFELIRTAIWITRNMISGESLLEVDWSSHIPMPPEVLSLQLKTIYDEMDRASNGI